MKNLKKVAALLQERVDAPTVKEPVLHLPVPERRNPVGFLGRKAELAWLGDELKKGTKPVIVAGLGGVGKTALAVEFQKGWAGNVYFATFRDTFTRTLADSVGMAIPVQERQGLNEEQTAELALGYLSRCEAGDLLIVDNAEVTGKKWRDLTKDPFYEKFRRLPMNVLMTTRHRDTGGRWLGRLALDELREIFRRHEVNIPEGEMDRLIDAVDGHTMTVDMIARTIRESWGDVTAEKILTAMANSTLNEADFDEIETDHDPEQRQIYAHLRALFDLSGIGDDGRQALRCATLLPQNGMQDALFVSALPKAAAKEIKLLEKKGWVDRKEGKVTIHPVVRLVCRTELEPTEENCEEFLDNCWAQFELGIVEQHQCKSLAELFAIAANTLDNLSTNCAKRALKIYWILSEKQLEQGDYKVALKSGLRILEINKKIFPQKYDELAISYEYVSKSLVFLDDYFEALEYQQKALTLWRKILPAEHPKLACLYNNIGCTYGEIGEHGSALEYLMKSLRINEKVLPANHPDLAICYSNVGTAFCNLKDHVNELEFHLKALEIRKQTHDSSDSELGLAYLHVANACYSLRKIILSARYMRRAAEIINRSTLPETHPNRVNYNKWADRLEREARQSRGAD